MSDNATFVAFAGIFFGAIVLIVAIIAFSEMSLGCDCDTFTEDEFDDDDVAAER